MQLSILTSILQSRVRYAAQSRVLGQVQQQQQINSVWCNNNTAASSLCELCRRRGIVDYDAVPYPIQQHILKARHYYKSGVVTVEGNVQ